MPRLSPASPPLKLLGLLLPASLVITACQNNRSLDTAELTKVAQYYVDQGGLALNARSSEPYERPCLRGVNLKNTILGGLFGGPGAAVDFIERQQLAAVTRTPDGAGRTQVSMVPTQAEQDNWTIDGNTGVYCFGKFSIVKVEPVPDAESIIAGSSEPYLIAGTRARSVRITFKLDGVSSASADAITATPNVLRPGSMLPANYGVEKTVVALLPEKIDNFQVNP